MQLAQVQLAQIQLAQIQLAQLERRRCPIALLANFQR